MSEAELVTEKLQSTVGFYYIIMNYFISESEFFYLIIFFRVLAFLIEVELITMLCWLPVCSRLIQLRVHVFFFIMLLKLLQVTRH